VDLDAFLQQLVGQPHLFQRLDRLRLQSVGTPRDRPVRSIVDNDDVDPEAH
jgi:hypothetical protein